MKALRNRGCPHIQRPYVAKTEYPLFSATLIWEKLVLQIPRWFQSNSMAKVREANQEGMTK